MAKLEFLSTAEDWLFLFYNHRMRKVPQCVFVVLHSWDKYEHLNKLCWAWHSKGAGAGQDSFFQILNDVHWTFITYTRFFCTLEKPLLLLICAASNSYW